MKLWTKIVELQLYIILFYVSLDEESILAKMLLRSEIAELMSIRDAEAGLQGDIGEALGVSNYFCCTHEVSLYKTWVFFFIFT